MTAVVEPETFTVTRYRCPFAGCRRSWQSKKRAEKHIATCWYNRGCKTCRHVLTLGGTWVDDCDLGENLRTDVDEPERVVPRSQCPLWESLSPDPAGQTEAG